MYIIHNFYCFFKRFLRKIFNVDKVFTICTNLHDIDYDIVQIILYYFNKIKAALV